MCTRGRVRAPEVGRDVGTDFSADPEGDPDAWIHSHYRRFERKDRLCAFLTQLGFELLEVAEKNGIAVYQDDDPVVVR